MTNTLTRQIANEIYENLNWDNMELIIIKDGEDIDYEIRLKNDQYIEGEELIVGAINLEKWYWAEILADWEIEDRDEVDEEIKEEFIADVIMPMVEQYI